MEYKDVVLDDFDLYVDELSGNAQELVEDTYGDHVSLKTAESNLAGIRKHLEQKKKLIRETGEFQYKKERYKFAEDGSKTTEKIILLSESEMNNPSVIMQKMGLDPIQWELLTCELSRKAYQVTMKLKRDGEETPKTETNNAFSCKIRAKPIQTKINTSDVAEALANIKTPKLAEYKYLSSGKMLVVPIMDAHFGLLAWKDETGNSHYDLGIAEATFKYVIKNILAKAKGNYDKILFPIGQDLYHVDTTDNTTTAGTHMDSDGRWPKIFSKGLECQIWAIEQLRQYGPVEVFRVPGNHDEMLSYCATEAIAQRYRECDNVTVDGKYPNPSPRKYVRYGNNLIGFSHGADESKSRLEKVMQVESGDWSDTLFREFHLGHLHHEKVWESGGILFRRISSMTPVSSWMNKKAMVGNVRKAQAFIYDKDKGLTDIINVIIA